MCAINQVTCWYWFVEAGIPDARLVRTGSTERRSLASRGTLAVMDGVAFQGIMVGGKSGTTGTAFVDFFHDGAWAQVML